MGGAAESRYMFSPKSNTHIVIVIGFSLIATHKSTTNSLSDHMLTYDYHVIMYDCHMIKYDYHMTRYDNLVTRSFTPVSLFSFLFHFFLLYCNMSII